MQNVSSNSFATVRRAFYSRAANNDDIPLQMCTVWGRREWERGRRKAALVMTAYKFQMQMLSQARQWQVHQGSPHSHLSVLYAAHVAAPAHGNLCGLARLWLNFLRCVFFVSLPTSALHHLSVLLPLAVVRQSRLHYANNLSQLSCATCCKFHKFQFRLSR